MYHQIIQEDDCQKKERKISRFYHHSYCIMYTHSIQENDYREWDNYIFCKKSILNFSQKHKQSFGGNFWDHGTRAGHSKSLGCPTLWMLTLMRSLVWKLKVPFPEVRNKLLFWFNWNQDKNVVSFMSLLVTVSLEKNCKMLG